MHSRQTCLITALRQRMQDTCHHVWKTKPLCHVLAVGMPNAVMKQSLSLPRSLLLFLLFFLLPVLALLLQRLDWPLYHVRTMNIPDPPSYPSLLCSYLGNAAERMLRPSFRRWLQQLRHVKVLRGVTMNTLLAKGLKMKEIKLSYPNMYNLYIIITCSEHETGKWST